MKTTTRVPNPAFDQTRLERHPNTVHFHIRGGLPGPFNKPGDGHWRRLFGPKDETNRFATLRAVVIAQQPKARKRT